MTSFLVGVLVICAVFVPLFALQVASLHCAKRRNETIVAVLPAAEGTGPCKKALLWSVLLFVAFTIIAEAAVLRLVLELTLGELVTGYPGSTGSGTGNAIVATGFYFYEFVTGIVKVAAGGLLAIYAVWLALHLSTFMYGFWCGKQLWTTGSFYMGLNFVLLAADAVFFFILLSGMVVALIC